MLASEEVVSHARERPRRGAAEWVREVLLSVLAVFGSLCLVVIVLVTVLDLGVIVFRTGSMGPTIPTGAAALVQSVPAGEVRVGDVVTVPSPVGPLPVTHRVVSSEPAGGDQYVLHLKGDANDVADPFDYQVGQVRRVVVSAPGLGYALVWLSDPRRMLALTVLVAVAVGWTLWPRSDPGTRRGRNRHADVAVVMLVLAAAGVSTAPPAAAGSAYPVPENGVPGRLSLTSSMPLSEQWTITPGGQLRWQVEAELGPPEETDQGGQLLVELVAEGPLAEVDDAALVTLEECIGADDSSQDCTGPTRELLATTSLGQALHTAPLDVGPLAPGGSRVVIVTLEVDDDVPEEQSLALRIGLVFTASGETASVIGAGATATGTDPLAFTGADLRIGALALFGVATGVLLLARARDARRAR